MFKDIWVDAEIVLRIDIFVVFVPIQFIHSTTTSWTFHWAFFFLFFPQKYTQTHSIFEQLLCCMEKIILIFQDWNYFIPEFLAFMCTSKRCAKSRHTTYAHIFHHTSSLLPSFHVSVSLSLYFHFHFILAIDKIRWCEKCIKCSEFFSQSFFCAALHVLSIHFSFFFSKIGRKISFVLNNKPKSKV